MAEAPRLVTHVTEAFVDRAPIDWAALLLRARTSRDRELFENLRIIAAVRDTNRPALRGRGPSARSSLIAWLVVALAATQTVCSLGGLGVAFVSGVTVTNKIHLIVLALAFAAACVPLVPTISRDRRSLFLLAAFASLASAFARPALTGLPAAWFAPFTPIVRGIVPESFAPACLWEFALDFPRVRRFTSFDVLARRAAAATWLLGAFLFGIHFLTAYHALHEARYSYLLLNHPSQEFWHLFTLSLVPAVGAILARSRRAPSFERRKVARFAIALAGGSAPFLLSGVVRAALPQVNDWFLTTSSPAHSWIHRLVFATLTATPVLSVAAVIADRPLESGGFLFEARSKLLHAIDRCILSRGLDYREQLAVALERVRLARGLREIIAVLARELRKTIGVDRVRLLVPHGEGAFVDPLRNAAMLSSDAVLITMLRETTRLLDLGSDRPLRALLPQRDRDWLVDNGVEILAPLMHHDGTIGAILTFGRKRCGCPFVRRDHWLMRTLITAAAAAWDADAADITAAEPARARPRPSEALGEVAFECPQCGVVARSEALPCGCGAEAVLASLPQHLGEKFVVQRRVGVGGMGVVYLARDTTLDRDVVLKTLPALRPDAGAHLRNEARAMAALNHDSVATIYGLERWRRTPVLVVEYFPNGTLARRLADGPLSPADAVRLGIKLARALAYIHARGVLHRDLKPSNIAFSATGVPKLLDFGLVTLIRPTTAGRGSLAGADDACGRLAGTSGYLPPEAYRGAPPTPAFDLWALSVVLIEAITGVNPFSVNHRGLTISGATAVDLTKIRSQQLSSSPPLRTFFERALARHPARRFQSGLEVQSALEALATWQGHSLDTSGVR